MPGRAQAVASGKALEQAVVELAEGLGLEARRQVRVGRRIWGAERLIDVVLTERDRRQRLGIECKYQGGPGSAEEKVPLILEDIAAWPIPGLVVFHGAGFTATGGGRLMAAFCVDGNGDPLMPCGRCRQLLYERGGPDLLIMTPEGVQTMAQILPQAFGPWDLTERKAGK